MKRRYLFLFLFLTISSWPALSFAFEIGVRGYYWFPSLDGDVRADEGGIKGTTIDFDTDLGIDDEDYPSFEVFLGSGNHHFSLIFTDIDYSGSDTLTRNILFNGQIYPIGALVDSSIEYQMIDFSYQYDFINLENILAGFSLGSVIQVKYLDGDVSLLTTGIDEKEDFSIPVPMLGLNLHVGILANILEGKIRGTGGTYSGDTVYELAGEISWTPFPFMDIHGGYKTFAIDIDEDDVVLDYDMSGPYITLTIGF